MSATESVCHRPAARRQRHGCVACAGNRAPAATEEGVDTQRLDEVVVTARRRGIAAGSAGRDQRVLGRGPHRHAGGQHRQPAGRGAEHEHRAGPRFVLVGERVHPRHRPARCAADLRPRASACTSTTSTTRASRRAVQALRHRPSKCCAPAGHALRQELTGGAIKIVTRDPGDETTGRRRGQRRQLRPARGEGYAAAPLNDNGASGAALVGTDNDGYVGSGHRQALQRRPTPRRCASSWSARRATPSRRCSRSTTPTRTTRSPSAIREAPLIRTDLASARSCAPADDGRYDFAPHLSLDPDQGQKLIHNRAAPPRR